jgi:hypothetical protein
MTSSLANAQVLRQFDLAFDLDWTLFYPVEKNGDAHAVQLPEGSFRMADGVPQVLLNLHRQGHRISLFSGGTAERNNGLAKVLIQKIRERGGADFSFYKILNFDDLSPRPNEAQDARFADLWMKDISKVNPDIRYVLLVDDMAKFAVPGQEKNIYWLNKTFNFYAQYDPSAKGEFDPPSEAAFRQERNKIVQFYENFQEVLKYIPDSEMLPALQELSHGQSLCPHAF